MVKPSMTSVEEVSADIVDTGNHNQHMAEDSGSVSSSTKRRWFVGDFGISKELVEFMFVACVIIILLGSCLYGIFGTDENQVFWTSLLTLLIGVVLPNPKLKSAENSSIKSYLKKHYFEQQQ